MFVYIDGDGVGQRLEGLVIDGNLRGAADLSQCAARALHEIEDQLRQARAEIVFGGGDNVLARMEADADLIDRLIALFYAETGLTASAGVGLTPTDAYLALQMAKADGGGRSWAWSGAEAA